MTDRTSPTFRRIHLLQRVRGSELTLGNDGVLALLYVSVGTINEQKIPFTKPNNIHPQKTGAIDKMSNQGKGDSVWYTIFSMT